MNAAGVPVNRPESVRGRLQNVARQRGVEFQQVLAEFAIERFLYRVGRSSHADRFVLKGANLFKLWSADRHRATWDLDLHGRGATGDVEIVAAVREVCTVPADDGIAFDVGSIRAEGIRATEEYAGIRVRLEAQLAGARIPMQVDFGFGDPITPPPTWEHYPTLLDHEAPRVKVYPRDAVVAEKVEAMVALGVTNSRMKDFYDVHYLASSFPFDGATLSAAVRATFGRRSTPVPDGVPLVLTSAFLAAAERRRQWQSFLRRSRLEGPSDSADLADTLGGFLVPVLSAISDGRRFAATWIPGGPWIGTPIPGSQ